MISVGEPDGRRTTTQPCRCTRFRCRPGIRSATQDCVSFKRRRSVLISWVSQWSDKKKDRPSEENQELTLLSFHPNHPSFHPSRLHDLSYQHCSSLSHSHLSGPSSHCQSCDSLTSALRFDRASLRSDRPWDQDARATQACISGRRASHRPTEYPLFLDAE